MDDNGAGPDNRDIVEDQIPAPEISGYAKSDQTSQKPTHTNVETKSNGRGAGIRNKWGDILKLMSGKANGGPIKNPSQTPRNRGKGKVKASRSWEVPKSQRLISSFMSSDQ